VKCLLFLALSTSAFGTSEPSPAPVPALETILERALDRAKKEDANDRTFKNLYEFTQSRVTEFKNPKGEVKKREEKTRVHDPAKLATSTKKTASVQDAETDARSQKRW